MEPKLAYFIKVFDFNGNLISDKVTSLRYKFSEEEDDVCEVEIESGDRFLADQDNLKEGKQLKVQWGWLNGTQSKKRTVYIFDRDTDYSRDGVVQLKLICHERFAVGKMDTVANKNLTQLKNNAPIIFSSNAIKNIKLDIQKGNTDLANLLKTNNIVLDGLSSTKDYGKNEVLVSYYNGNMSTYYSLRNFLDRLPGGPYIMDSRDDILTVRTRELGNPSVKTFTWMGGSGELLSFKPMTKNRSKKASAESIDVSTYDPLTKTATNVSAKSKEQTAPKLAEGKTIDIYLDDHSFDQIKGIKKPNPPVYIPRPTDKLFTSEDIHRALIQDKENERIATRNRLARSFGSDKLLTAIEKNRNSKTNTNPYNDFKKNEVDKALIVENGKVNNASVQKLYLGSNTGKTFQGGNSRDNTAIPRNNFALVADQKSLKNNLMSNDSPEKAAALAENQRQDAELKNNPGSAELIGQPEIECGQIITIEGVAKINQGNYYICDCEHILKDTEYNLTLSLSRDGVTKSSTTRTKKGLKLKDVIVGNPNVVYNTPEVNNSIVHVGNTSHILNTSRGPEANNPQNKKKVITKTPDKS